MQTHSGLTQRFRQTPIIQPSIVHTNRATGPEHSCQNHFPIGILNSGIDFPRSRCHIDNRTDTNPQGTIGIPHPQVTRTRMRKCNIFNSVIRCFLWHGTKNSENENLVENHKVNKNYNISERKINSEVEKNGRKQSVNWNHTDMILYWNQTDSHSVQVDINHNNSNQPMPVDLINIGSIHTSADICVIEKILASPLHSPVPASPIFSYRSESRHCMTHHSKE